MHACSRDSYFVGNIGREDDEAGKVSWGPVLQGKAKEAGF